MPCPGQPWDGPFHRARSASPRGGENGDFPCLYRQIFLSQLLGTKGRLVTSGKFKPPDSHSLKGYCVEMDTKMLPLPARRSCPSHRNCLRPLLGLR